MITLSCSSCCIPAYGFDDFLALVKESGYTHFETFVTWTGSKLDTTDEPLREAKRRITDSGLKLSSLNIENIPAEDVDAQDARFERQKRHIDAAIELGARTANFKGGKRADADLDALLKGVERLARHVEDLPIELAVGNHHGNRVERLEDFNRLFAEIDHPKVGMLVDIGHFHSAEEPIPPIMDTHADRIKLLHTKDQIGTRSVAFGLGEIDNAGLLRQARQLGSLVVEVEVEDKENSPTYIRAARPYLQAMLDA
ncbi:MAG: sugar phosphate isomerase/epimerase [Candidatus Poribacteria bacterium]|nr:sugar phosphate isomerase/epimerase [Candidatus Poribacteria bacterium]